MGEMAYKICIFGESRVGKTSLAHRYLTGYFEEDIKLTMGAEIFVKYLTVENTRIVLQIWDFGGEDDFKFLLPIYSKGSSGGIFMFDLSAKNTLNRIEEWISIFKNGLEPNKKKAPILLVGGKSDLKNQISVSNDDTLLTIKDYDLYNYIKCSSKTGKNVELLFIDLVKKIMKIQNLI